MPLLTPLQISNKIREISDENYSGFIGFPNDVLEASLMWASIIQDTIVGVVPSSTTVSAASAIFNSILQGIDVNSNNGEQLFVQAFTQMALTLSGGMSPSYVGVAPPVPIVLTSAFQSGFNGATAEIVSQQLANIIYLWLKTGTANPVPSGPTINWT